MVDLTNGQSGPWHITVWASPTELVPFSRSVVLKQNSTNGLFSAKASGKDPKIGLWCGTTTSATVVGFSGDEESLLLDGIFG